MKADILAGLLAARHARKPVAVVTELATGAQRIVPRGDDPALEERFRFDRSGVDGDDFVHIHNPPLRLVIVGAVHIAQAVIPFAQAASYDVIVVDPRGAFATDARFPGVALHEEWPDEILPKLGLDARTAFMALTHDPKIDDAALLAAMASDVFYIGALGSKKNQAARLERLAGKGAAPEQLARINGPIGLAIGAQGAPEIAISIMAEMTTALRLGQP
jgi:xanthine dehydrogenase accessory factor